MKQKTQYFLYVLFAVLSTFVNIGIQKGMELLFTKAFSCNLYIQKVVGSSRITYGLITQMLTATIIAFVFKYIVDKLIIFKDKTSYFSADHFKQVILYGSFAVITTLIFWGTELGFKRFFHFNNSEYLGAVIGLAIGYTIKYLLDRKYVFTNVL